MDALGIPEFCWATLRREDRPTAAAAVWLTTLPPGFTLGRQPWHRAVRLSAAAATALHIEGDSWAGRRLTMQLHLATMSVLPSRIDDMLAGNEVGLHSADAATLGISDWAVVNHHGLPAAMRVRTSTTDHDRGLVRLSYQARMLLGVERNPHGFRSEVTLSPCAPGARRLSRPAARRLLRQRLAGLGSVWHVTTDVLDSFLGAVLGAPAVTLRTMETTPGEDLAIAVRLPPAAFPLLQTKPGMPVSVEWGPAGRTVATALESDEPDPAWPDIAHVGPRLDPDLTVPTVLTIGLGAPTRADLGIPRRTTVTVRRRVVPLVASRLNELIVPTTGLFLALAINARLPAPQLALATAIILVLLISPLRARLVRRRRRN